MRLSTGSMAALLGVAAILLAAGGGRAELQRVEAVGIYGIRDAMRSRVVPRDEAIAKARWEGVSRVALELIGESAPSEVGVQIRVTPPELRPDEPVVPPIEVPGPSESDGPSNDGAAVLRAALGEDVLPYMRSYRILEDRGEVPVLFNDEPDVKVEYVVVVEVLVDVDRVTRALENAGLIAKVNSNDAAEAVVVELIGLSSYAALELILRALREQFGATRIRTLEFSRERQILAVEGPFGPSALSAKLAGFEDPRLLLEPVGIDSAGRRIRLIGRWFPDPDATQATPASKSKAARIPRS
jgi:hypothetical protein